MSIREAMRRFRQLHDDHKAGAFKSPEARAFYESERDEFLLALLKGQQLAVKAGQSPRQALRVAIALELVLQIGPRRETAATVDLASAGFAAIVSSPLGLNILCDFEIGGADPVRGRARVVACTRDPSGRYRASFSILTMPEADRARLDNAVIDVALGAAQASLPK